MVRGDGREEQHILSQCLQLQDSWVCAGPESWPPGLLCRPLRVLPPPECGLLGQQNERSGSAVGVPPLWGCLRLQAQPQSLG